MGNCGDTEKGGGGGGGVIRCVTYVPLILIPSKEPSLIKLTSDAVLFPLINGCENHRKKMQQQSRRRGGYGVALLTLCPTCRRDSAAAGNNDPCQGVRVPFGRGLPLHHSVRGVPPPRQLQSGLLIKPHEANKAHYRHPQTEFSVGPTYSEPVQLEPPTATGQIHCTCTASASHTNRAFDVVWLVAASKAG